MKFLWLLSHQIFKIIVEQYWHRVTKVLHICLHKWGRGWWNVVQYSGGRRRQCIYSIEHLMSFFCIGILSSLTDSLRDPFAAFSGWRLSWFSIEVNVMIDSCSALCLCFSKEIVYQLSKMFSLWNTDKSCCINLLLWISSNINLHILIICILVSAVTMQKSTFNTWSNKEFFLWLVSFLLGNILCSNGKYNFLHILQACKVTSFNKNLWGFSCFIMVSFKFLWKLKADFAYSATCPSHC